MRSFAETAILLVDSYTGWDFLNRLTGDATDHAQHSAEAARQILINLNRFTQVEIDGICNAIAQHSTKDERGGALSELIKDADVLQHFLYNPALVGNKALYWEKRLSSVLDELGIKSP
jgi:hypothetical protein